jgi:hypothetical protein
MKSECTLVIASQWSAFAVKFHQVQQLHGLYAIDVLKALDHFCVRSFKLSKITAV